MDSTSIYQGDGATAAKEAAANPVLAAVPDHIIPAALPHPQIQGSPLARGARYIHHFEVELVYDGRRFWHVLSEEGKAVLAWMAGDRTATEIDRLKNAPPMQEGDTHDPEGLKPSSDGGSGKDPMNLGNANPNAEPAPTKVDAPAPAAAAPKNPGLSVS